MVIAGRLCLPPALQSEPDFNLGLQRLENHPADHRTIVSIGK